MKPISGQVFTKPVVHPIYFQDVIKKEWSWSRQSAFQIHKQLAEQANTMTYLPDETDNESKSVRLGLFNAEDAWTVVQNVYRLIRHWSLL